MSLKRLRVAVTGELGFIGRNIVEQMKHASNESSFEHVPLLMATDSAEGPAEICIAQNNAEMWAEMLSERKVDVVIHNAAVVGSDVVKLRPNKACLTNVLGTQHIVDACNRIDVPICFMGTTACYDVTLYQNSYMDEQSVQRPQTLYGIHKFAAEQIVEMLAKQWMVMRPLFCFGGIGDMNSLIAKACYASATGQQVHMHLDPTKYKDWLHVTDFAAAVLLAIREHMWGQKWNVSYQSKITPNDVMKMLATLGVNPDCVVWHPETDYMGNHLVSSEKFRAKTGWKPALKFEEGVTMAKHDIDAYVAKTGSSTNYDPLRFSKEMYGDKRQQQPDWAPPRFSGDIVTE